MPEPQVMIASRLQHDASCLLLAFELALPGCWTVLPPRVHAVQGTKHALDLVNRLVECHYVFDVFRCWQPQVLRLVELLDHLVELATTSLCEGL